MSKIGFVCCVKEGYDCIRSLIKKEFHIDFIITLTKELAAKYSGAVYFDRLASKAGIALYKVESLNCAESKSLLEKLSPTILFVVGWSEIINEQILSLPKKGVIGFHASLLPEYRGSAPVNWAIINGENKTGNTMFWMSSGIDTGHIIQQKIIKIKENSTCKTVYSKVSRSEVDMIIDNIDNLLAGKMRGKPQTNILPKSKRRFPEDGIIRWDKNAYEIYNYIRALTRPYPGAFTFFKNKKLYFWKAKYENSKKSSNYSPGTVLNISSKGIRIACHQGVLILEELQFQGKKSLRGKQFAEKYNLKNKDVIFDAPRTVAVFAAHYDDEVLGIGGTLIEHFKRGDDIYIYIVCESSSVRYRGGNIPLHSYAQDASYYLGAKKSICFEFPDQRLDTIPLIELTQRIESELKKIKPHIVYTHFAGDINEDHNIVNKAVMTACRPHNANYVRMLAVCETPSSTEWGDYQEGKSTFSPNCFTDISSSLERKFCAMRCYKSEIKPNNHPRSIEALKNRAKNWGNICKMEYAEPLIIVRLLDPLKL